MPQIEIHVKGSIDPGMADWFQVVSVKSISLEETYLYCEAIDDSAIYGILSTLSSLGLSLISVLVTDHDGIRSSEKSSL